MKYFVCITLLLNIYIAAICQGNQTYNAAIQAEDRNQLRTALTFYLELNDAEEAKYKETGLYKSGEIYSRLNMPEEGNKKLNQYILCFPNGLYINHAYFWLGTNYLYRSNPDINKALESYHYVENHSDKYFLLLKSYYGLGVAYIEINEYSLAKKYFQKILNASTYDLTGEDKTLKENAKQGIRTIEIKEKEQSNNNMILAVAYYNSKGYKKSLSLLKEFIDDKSSSNHISALRYGVLCYHHLNDRKNVYLLSKEYFKDATEQANEDYEILYYYSVAAINTDKARTPEIPEILLKIVRQNNTYSKNARYYLGYVYEKQNNTTGAIIQYRAYIQEYPNGDKARYCKKALEELLREPEERPKDYYDFFTYTKTFEDNIQVINIHEIGSNARLQPTRNPGIIFIPLYIENVNKNNVIKITLESTPYSDNNRIGYLEINTDVPRSKANVFSRDIQIYVEQKGRCTAAKNDLKKSQVMGIWGSGLYSIMDYSKPLNITLTVNDLGMSFQDIIPKDKQESGLFVTIIMGESDASAKSTINNAKDKATRLMYVAGLGIE